MSQWKTVLNFQLSENTEIPPTSGKARRECWKRGRKDGLKQEIISERLKEMDTVLEELSLYRDKAPEDFKASLSMR